MGEGNDIINVIWKSFQSGDKEAFAYIYKVNVDALFRYGTKLTPDEEIVKDSIHEVFLDLYMKRKKNKTNPKNLKYYLILALKRNLIKKLVKSRNLVKGEINNELFEPVYGIENDIIQNELDFEKNIKLRNALNSLPNKQREVLYLRYNESLDYSEISKLLNISVESVRKQVYRGIKSIRETYKKGILVFLSILSKRI